MKQQHKYPQHFSEYCITCTCGHCSLIDTFWHEGGTYHCKKCKRSWEVKREGKAIITQSGFVIPPKLRITYIERQ